MFENGREIKIGKKTYRALFNVAAMEEMVEKYGGIEGFSEALEKDHAKALNEYSWMIALLVRQGIALKNFEDGTDDKALTVDQVKLLLRPGRFVKYKDEIMGAISDGMDSGEELGDTEEVDEVLEEVLATKNEMGVKE